MPALFKLIRSRKHPQRLNHTSNTPVPFGGRRFGREHVARPRQQARLNDAEDSQRDDQWDTRLLTGRHVAYLKQGDPKALYFDRSKDGRIKTGRAAIGTVSRRTQRLCESVWAWRELELTPDAYLWRKANGQPFRDHEMAKAFTSIRDEGDDRQLRDMRRSGSGEANASGSSNPGLLSAKLANSIQTSNALHKTYAPVDVDAVLAFDKARLAGRQKRRGQNEN